MAQLTVSQVLRWDPKAIDDVFRLAKDRTATLHTFGEDMRRTQNALKDWTGDAGTAFHEAVGQHRTDIDNAGHESASVARAIDRAERDVEDFQIKVRGELAAAKDMHLTVSDDWKVTIAEGQADNAENRHARDYMQSEMDKSASRADAIDEEIAAAIRASVGKQDLDSEGRPTGAPRKPENDLLTVKQLHEIFPTLPMADVEKNVGPLNEAMRAAGMTTPESRAAFLATFAVESGELKYPAELRSKQSANEMYGPEYKGVTFTNDVPHDPDTPTGYTNSSAGLGNTEPGDGDRFRGRGPIQLTGRGNYAAAGQAIGVDLVNNPDAAADPANSFRVATWFWNNHYAKGPDGTILLNADGSNMTLNQAANSGNFAAVTRSVNGGYTGQGERQAYFDRAVAALR